MKKIKSSLDNKLLILFILKSIIISAAFCLGLSALISLVIYKLDISFECVEYLSVAVIVISAALNAYFCSSSFKNSGFLVGVISSLPLVLYSLVNLIFNHNTLWLFFIKLICVVLVSGFAGMYSVKKSKKIRVKK